MGTRAKAFKLLKADKKLVRFYLPLVPKSPDNGVWSVIRTLADKIGEELTTFPPPSRKFDYKTSGVHFLVGSSSVA